jgi:hypothetical protein
LIDLRSLDVGNLSTLFAIGDDAESASKRDTTIAASVPPSRGISVQIESPSPTGQQPSAVDGAEMGLPYGKILQALSKQWPAKAVKDAIRRLAAKGLVALTPGC